MDPVAAPPISPVLRFGFALPANVLDLESEAGRLAQLGHGDYRVRRVASWKLLSIPKTNTVIRGITAARPRKGLRDSQQPAQQSHEAGARAEPAIPAVAGQLGEDEYGGCYLAAGTLMRYGAKAQGDVIKAYGDRTGKYPVVQQALAGWLLAQWVAEKNPELHAAVFDALKSPHVSSERYLPGVSVGAGKAGRPYVKAPSGLLADETQAVAIDAASWRSVALGIPAAIPKLKQAYATGKTGLSRRALQAIGEIGCTKTDTAKNTLIAMLATERDRNKPAPPLSVRWGHTLGSEGVKVLVPVLTSIQKTERDEQIRAAGWPKPRAATTCLDEAPPRRENLEHRYPSDLPDALGYRSAPGGTNV